MTLEELIDSEPLNTTRSHQEVLDWLNEGSGQYRAELVNARQLMARFGAQIAADFLDKLAAVADNRVQWIMKFIVTDGIDVGDSQTRAMMDALVTANKITDVERDAIKGLATEMSRWEAVGLSGPKLGHIQEARK